MEQEARVTHARILQGQMLFPNHSPGLCPACFSQQPEADMVTTSSWQQAKLLIMELCQAAGFYA